MKYTNIIITLFVSTSFFAPLARAAAKPLLNNQDQKGLGERSKKDESDLFPTLWPHSFQQKNILRCSKHCMVSSAQFNRDGSRIVTTDSDNYMRIWDSQTGNLICQAEDSDGILEEAYFGGDNTSVITLAQGGWVKKRNAASCALQETLREGSDEYRENQKTPQNNINITPLVYTGSGHALKVRQEEKEEGEDNPVIAWNAQKDRPYAHLIGHTDYVSWIDVSPNGKLIVTAGDDGTARVWESWLNSKALSPEQINLLLLLEKNRQDKKPINVEQQALNVFNPQLRKVIIEAYTQNQPKALESQTPASTSNLPPIKE